MEPKIKISLPKVLHYLFLCLTLAAGLLFLLDLASSLGFTGHNPCIRGWVTTIGDFSKTKNGELQVFNWGERKFVMLELAGAQGLLQARYVAYLFFQHLQFALIAFVFYQMYRIFRNIDRGLMFREDNTRRIRMIGAAALAFPVANVVAARMIAGIAHDAGGRQIATAIPSLLSEQIVLGALLALILMSLAEIFRKGSFLQQEQDLTI